MTALLPLIDKFLEEGDPAVYEGAINTRFDAERMIVECGKNAKAKGFWDVHQLEGEDIIAQVLVNEGYLDIADRVASKVGQAMAKAKLLGDPIIFLALMMTECGEAIEAVRRENRIGKDGMWEEVADVLIRLFDFVARYGPEDDVHPRHFMELVAAKMAKNARRPRLHGKTC